jgi:hypothetical protein
MKALSEVQRAAWIGRAVPTTRLIKAQPNRVGTRRENIGR